MKAIEQHFLVVLFVFAPSRNFVFNDELRETYSFVNHSNKKEDNSLFHANENASFPGINLRSSL